MTEGTSGNFLPCLPGETTFKRSKLQHEKGKPAQRQCFFKTVSPTTSQLSLHILGPGPATLLGSSPNLNISVPTPKALYLQVSQAPFSSLNTTGSSSTMETPFNTRPHHRMASVTALNRHALHRIPAGGEQRPMGNLVSMKPTLGHT